MKIITEPYKMRDCALALGNFDGVHRAHTEIINLCTEYAKNNGLLSGVLIFKSHTENLISGKDIKVLTTLEEKIRSIEALGIDFVFIKEFDREFMEKTPQGFIGFLKDELKVKAIFAGFDYTFGKNAAGKCEDLKKLGAKNDIYVNVSDKIEIDGKPLSSSDIRELIKSGDVKKASEHLGRCYSLFGEVVYGKQNGRKMGLPTANIDYDEEKVIPSDGVYFGGCELDGKEYKSLINIGKNPTFNAEKRTVEVHIPNFSDNLYGKLVKVRFIYKMRDEIKFSSVDELIKQIKSDIDKVINERI